jgi:hypothetical protein
LGDVTHHSPAHPLTAAFIPTDLPPPFSVKLRFTVDGTDPHVRAVVSFAVAATSSSNYPFTNRRGQSLALRPLNHSPLRHAKQIEVIIMQFDGEKD